MNDVVALPLLFEWTLWMVRLIASLLLSPAELLYVYLISEFSSPETHFVNTGLLDSGCLSDNASGSRIRCVGSKLLDCSSES